MGITMEDCGFIPYLYWNGTACIFATCAQIKVVYGPKCASPYSFLKQNVIKETCLVGTADIGGFCTGTPYSNTVAPQTSVMNCAINVVGNYFNTYSSASSSCVFCVGNTDSAIAVGALWTAPGCWECKDFKSYFDCTNNKLLNGITRGSSTINYCTWLPRNKTAP